MLCHFSSLLPHYSRNSRLAQSGKQTLVILPALNENVFKEPNPPPYVNSEQSPRRFERNSASSGDFMAVTSLVHADFSVNKLSVMPLIA
jgi:hypothetical protein